MNIEVNKSAAAYLTQEMTIDAPAERIFNILANIPGWPEWQSNVKKAEIITGSGNNKNFIWKAGRMKIKSTFHTVTPYSELGWTGKIGWIKAVHNWYFKQEHNTTQVSVSESLEGFGAGLMRQTLRRGIIKSLKELKEVSENGI